MNTEDNADFYSPDTLNSADDKTIKKRISNPPYQDSIYYRIGTFESFRTAMLNATAQKMSLRNWTKDQNRNDYGITLLEAWAYISDVLAFYQERIANGAFIRTAELDESLIELYYLVNYIPISTRSASAYVKLEARENIAPTLIPKGFKLRASPKEPKDPAVMFETDEPILISPDLNLMKLAGWKTGFRLEKRSIRLVLDRSYSNMDKGDVLMITDGDNYDIVTVTEVAEKDGKTEIKWSEEDALQSEYSFSRVKILKFTQTARPFGYDAAPPFLCSIRGVLYRQYVDEYGKKTVRKPVADMPLALVDNSKTRVKTMRTNAKGEFRFTELTPGNYRVQTLIAEELKQKLPPTDENYSVGSIEISLLPGFELQYDIILEILMTKSRIAGPQGSEEDLPKIPIVDLESVLTLTNAIVNEPLSDEVIKAKIQQSVPGFEKADKFVQTIKELKSEDLLIRPTSLARTLHSIFQGVSNPDNLKAKVQHSIANLSPAKLEAIVLSMERLFPSLRVSLRLEFLQMVQYDIVGDDSLTPIVYLDRAYSNLEVGSLLVLKPEHGTEALDAETSLYRIVNATTEFHSQYGAAKNVTVLTLASVKSSKPIPKLGSSFAVRNTLVFTNPTLELRPDPQFGSHELWQNDDVLEVEGVHSSLRRGGYVSITDNTSSVSGGVTDNQFRPLSDYSVRIYMTSEIKEDTIRGQHSAIPSEAGKTKDGTRKVLIKHLKHVITTDDGRFDFGNLLADSYLIVLSVPPSKYWQLFLEANNRDRNSKITNEILKICNRLASNRKNRSIATALEISLFLNGYILEDLMDESARPGVAHKVLGLLRGIDSLEDDIGKSMQRYREPIIIGMGRAQNAPDTVDSSSSIIQFSTSEEENLHDALDSIDYKLQELKKITYALLQEISGMLFDESHESLNQLADDILLQVDIVREALRIIKLGLESSLQADRLDCPMGATQEISLKSNTDLTLTITIGSNREFSYFVSNSESSKAEIRQILSVGFLEGKTSLRLDAPLYFEYVKGLAQISCNIVTASHGETVGPEILGSGEATLRYQQFKLRRGPLTHLSASENPDKVKSTLHVFVDGIEWEERFDFLTSSPTDRHYVISLDDDGAPIIMFGDGINGSTLPSGIDNVIAYYRVGTGNVGNLDSSSSLVPAENNPAIKSVSLPIGSFGGYSDTPKGQKKNVLSYVSCLDRAVSVQDYSNLALCFPGIDKARAVPYRTDGIDAIKLIVAGKLGRAISPALLSDLNKYMSMRRDIAVPLITESFTAVPIDIIVEVDIDEKYRRTDIVRGIEEKLCPGSMMAPVDNTSFFAFSRAEIGSPVRLSDVYRVIERISGVDNVIVRKFGRRDSDKEVQEIIYCGESEILMCNNDPSDPSNGTLEVIAKGGSDNL